MSIAFKLGLCLLVTATSLEAAERTMLQRDVEGYVVAACLTRQREPLLSEQGGSWADAIIQRSAGGIETFTRLSNAVDAELKRNPVVIGRDDRTGKSKSMPVLLCGEMIDVPSVRAAITLAEARLARDYRNRRPEWPAK